MPNIKKVRVLECPEDDREQVASLLLAVLTSESRTLSVDRRWDKDQGGWTLYLNEIHEELDQNETC